MADRPLGIADLYHAPINLSPDTPEHWIWCRAHEQARKNTDECSTSNDFSAIVYPPHSCIAIGPFMSEREANRLNGEGKGLALRHSRPSLDVPLGMEVD